MAKQRENAREVKAAILSIADDWMARTGKDRVSGTELSRYLGKGRSGQSTCHRWFSRNEKYAEHVPTDDVFNKLEDFFGVTHGEIVRRSGGSDAPTIDFSALIQGTIRIVNGPINLPESTAKTIIGLISNDDDNLEPTFKQMVLETYGLARELSAAARTNQQMVVAAATQPIQGELLQHAS